MQFAPMFYVSVHLTTHSVSLVWIFTAYLYCDAGVAGSRPKSGSFSSSGRSESSAGGAGGASSGNETEEGELKARHLLVANHGSNGQRVLVKIRPPQLPARQHREASCSTDGRQSSDEEDDDDDDEEEEEEEEGDSNSSALSGDMDTSPAGRSIEGIPRPIAGSSNLKMRIIAPDRRRVISRPCLPQGNIQARLAPSDADLFSGHMHLPQLTPKSAKYGKLAHQRQQLTPEDNEEAGHMSDSEDSVMQQIKMKVVHRAAEHGDMCAHPGDEDDDDDDDDDDGDEEEEESSEYASSPDSAHRAAVIDQSASAKSCRRRHGENLNSDDEGTPKRKRSKSDADAGKMQPRNGVEMTKDITSKEADSASKMLGTEVSVMNESGEPTAAEPEQASSSASLQDNIPLSQVTEQLFTLHFVL